ncbi:4-oxalocrotonate tautomerase [Gordonia sp. TBRC 11910]|uniref:4-oxalocrotonate tautomerase n=1 Tax=Gordonia asplenii TaxID=2725283 RepID=A0A848L6Z6_9ACTN|nr:tautomerase family protein [Gordonia asplenii]NMO04473.1 4-oxalocrotonate tautomerase [Gordonia asplenii]
MPQIAVQLRHGRDPQSVRTLISAVTTAVVESLSVPAETVRVIVTEIPTTHWANGDVTLAEKAQRAGGQA